LLYTILQRSIRIFKSCGLISGLFGISYASFCNYWHITLADPRGFSVGQVLIFQRNKLFPNTNVWIVYQEFVNGVPVRATKEFWHSLTQLKNNERCSQYHNKWVTILLCHYIIKYWLICYGIASIFHYRFIFSNKITPRKQI